MPVGALDTPIVADAEPTTTTSRPTTGGEVI